MATLKLSSSARNAAADSVVDLIDGGVGSGLILIYSGAIPATPETAITTETLLATLTFSDPAFGSASSGVATANAITSDTSADGSASVTAGWARIVTSAGTAIFDCDVGASGSGATIILNTVSIAPGATVSVTSATITMPAS